jgi:hypothetical protein
VFTWVSVSVVAASTIRWPSGVNMGSASVAPLGRVTAERLTDSSVARSMR